MYVRPRAPGRIPREIQRGNKQFRGSSDREHGRVKRAKCIGCILYTWSIERRVKQSSAGGEAAVSGKMLDFKFKCTARLWSLSDRGCISYQCWDHRGHPLGTLFLRAAVELETSNCSCKAARRRGHHGKGRKEIAMELEVSLAH